MTELNQIKANFGGDIKLALKTGIESDIAAPTTRAKMEWALEEIERLKEAEHFAYNDGWYAGWSAGYGDGYEDGQ